MEDEKFVENIKNSDATVLADVIRSQCITFVACRRGSITALWLCFLCVLVHNNKCVQGRILRLKKGGGGGGGHTFRVEIGAARKPRPLAFAHSSLAVRRSKARERGQVQIACTVF